MAITALPNDVPVSDPEPARITAILHDHENAVIAEPHLNDLAVTAGTTRPSVHFVEMSSQHAQKCMRRYRCCLLASDGRVNSRREYLAKDDTEAVEFAHAMDKTQKEATSLRHGFEVWQGVRLVVREA